MHLQLGWHGGESGFLNEPVYTQLGMAQNYRLGSNILHMCLIFLGPVNYPRHYFLMVMTEAQERKVNYVSTFQASACVMFANIL